MKYYLADIFHYNASMQIIAESRHIRAALIKTELLIKVPMVVDCGSPMAKDGSRYPRGYREGRNEKEE